MLSTVTVYCKFDINPPFNRTLEDCYHIPCVDFRPSDVGLMGVLSNNVVAVNKVS